MRRFLGRLCVILAVGIPALTEQGFSLDIAADSAFTIVRQHSAEMLFVKSADIDMDNYVDIIFTGYLYDHTLRIAYGTPTGGFTPPVTCLSSIWCAPIAVGYVNGDTLPDIISVGTNSSIRILINQGHRSYSTKTISYTAPTIPCLATGYFNNDPNLDLIVGPGTIFYGDGNGNFPTSNAVSYSIQGVDVGDFNNDGQDDFIAHVGSTGTIYLNNGDGSFAAAGSIGIGTSTYALTTADGLADFNGDGNLDFSAVNYESSATPHQSTVIVGLGDGMGGFLPGGLRSTIMGYGLQTVIADVNRDRALDVVTVATASPPALYVFYGDGNGAFPDSLAFTLTGIPNSTWAIAGGDFDRDGNPDFITGSWSSTDSLTVLYNRAPDAPVLSEEMVVTAFSDAASNYPHIPAVDINVFNPSQFEIARNVRSVAGSAFARFDVDRNSALDERSTDYNLQEGEYVIVIRPGNGASPGGQFTMDIRMDGSSNVKVFKDYESGVAGLANGLMNAGDSILFYYTVESTPSMRPPNGLKTTTQTPTFRWGKLVDSVTAAYYQFQLDKYFDFRAPRFDIADLPSASFRPADSLGVDSIYYWRARANNGSSWGPWTRTMAAYIGTGGCCEGVTGNVNCTGIVDLTDLSMLICYLTCQPKPTLCCPAEANVNGVGIIDLSDLSMLIAYLTVFPRPTLPDCL